MHALQFSGSQLSASPTPKHTHKDRPAQVCPLPSSMVTFPRKKYFPWPLESATPKLCGETKQTLKSRAPTGIDLWANIFFLFIFHFHISISCSVNSFSNSLLSKTSLIIVGVGFSQGQAAASKSFLIGNASGNWLVVCLQDLWPTACPSRKPSPGCPPRPHTLLPATTLHTSVLHFLGDLQPPEILP